MAISARTPEGNGAVTDRPSTPMNSTVDSLPCGAARTFADTPSRSSTDQQVGFRQSPQTFSRGNRARSSTSVRQPASAQNAAQLAPAGPLPTMATSHIFAYSPRMRPTRPPLHQSSLTTVPLSKEKPDLNKKVHKVPHKPGVYLMRDRFGRVIYVGKARDLRKRVGSYFLPSKMAVADLKTRALLEAVWDFETHTVASEAESILLEGKLIKEYRPRYNISFRDDKRFLVVKVAPTDEWPRFRLARFKKDDGARYFGPYAHAGALRQTLNFMRKKFGVLTFGRGSPTERELKSSTYQVPMRLSEINAEIYRQRVEQASDFLEGHSREMMNAVEEEMQKAATKLDFEKAAELRNMLEDLRRTTKPMRRFTRHSLPTTIDPQADVQALADTLQLPRLPNVMECFDISNISTTHVVPRWCAFAKACRTRTTTGVTASARLRARTISRAWQ